MRKAAKSVGFVFEALPMRFSSGIAVRRFTKLVEGRPVMLDVLLVEGALEPIWSDRQQLPFEDGEIWTVS